MRFKVWEAHGTKLNLLTVVLYLVPQFYNLESRNFSWNLLESGDLGSFTHKTLFSPTHLGFLGMFLWLLLQEKLFFLWANLDLDVPVLEDRRKKVFWNIEDGSCLFLCILFWGKEICLVFGEGSGLQQDVYIQNIHNSTALPALLFLGINRILLLWFMSLLAHIPSSSPSFLAFLLQH